MFIFLRDSFFGRSLYHLSGRRLFCHKEEKPDYIVPEIFHIKQCEQVLTADKDAIDTSSNPSCTTISDEGKIVVGWDGDDDPENPYNWPTYQKVFFSLEIMFLTVTVYMASAIYTPGIEQIKEEFGVSQVIATVPLTMFVIGYGLGPMILSPMSENAIFGRTSIYIITLFIFFVLQIPTALATNITSLSILRFISGIFSSPALATGGASMADIFNKANLPVALASWDMAAVGGPSVGPLFGSIFTAKKGWRWTFWFEGIVAGICFVILGWGLPETFDKTLLLRKAKRLRALTGNENITSEGEIENSRLTARELAIEILVKPIEITFMEPVVLLIDVYSALIYSVLYLWFEAFPIVFSEIYHFSLIKVGVMYTSVMIGSIIGAVFYVMYIHKKVTVPTMAGAELYPEVFLPPMIVGSVIMPIGIFIFGWSATADAHWLGPYIGSALFALAAFVIFQTGFNYLGSSFSKYLASAYASNDVFRSLVGGCFPLFGSPLFNNLATKKYPVAWGSTILGIISIIMIAIPVLFHMNGPKLRARSKYAS